MKQLHIISGIITMMMVSSCMADVDMSGNGMPASPEEMPAIHGKVSDQEGNPIEHIKVTLNWNEGEDTDIKYTSGTGTFSSQIREYGNDAATTLRITMEDIDGEMNGGTFESHTDIITLFDAETPTDSVNVINLDYRLNRATASENIPQS